MVPNRRLLKHWGRGGLQHAGSDIVVMVVMFLACICTRMRSPQVAERFPNARGVLITAGDEGATYYFRAANKAEHSGFVPSFKVRACAGLPARPPTRLPPWHWLAGSGVG